MGSCYVSMHRLDSAMTCYQRARAHGDIDSTALTEMGRICKEMGRDVEAAKYFSELVDNHDDDDKADPDPPHVVQAVTFLLDDALRGQRLEEAEGYALRLQRQDGPVRCAPCPLSPLAVS